MTVVVNGAPMDVTAECTVFDVLGRLGRPQGRGVAVAVNGEVVARSEWPRRRLAPGDRVEVLGAIGGG
jgi:sulfur carrier protein